MTSLCSSVGSRRKLWKFRSCSTGDVALLLLAGFLDIILGPLSDSPSCGGYASVLEAFGRFRSIFRRGQSCNIWFDSGYIFFIGLWMALEEFHIFLRGLVDSDPEVVASLSHVATLVVNNGSACTHLPQWQWHAFYWFCWYSCTLCRVPDFCQQEVAELVFNGGSGMHSNGFAGKYATRAVFLMIAGRPSWFRLATRSGSWHRATDHGGNMRFLQVSSFWTRSLAFVVMQRQVLGICLSRKLRKFHSCSSRTRSSTCPLL